ncbi:MAG: hypothetical protein RJA70_73 [Pseudomonadota bacterium]
MKRVLLISPLEPSGVTWLINVLLELQVCTWRGRRRHMWREQNGVATLTRQQDELKRWLPALSDHSCFRFRPGIEVQWAHHWPAPKYRDQQTLLFVRDPRDALYSRYRRDAAALTYLEYADFPCIWSLLNKVDSWCLFMRFWLAQPQIQVVRFEDYRLRPFDTVQQVLRTLGLTATDGEIETALAASTFARAQEAESTWRAANLSPGLATINRAGSVGSYAQLSGPDATVAEAFLARGADLLNRFGYEQGVDESRVPDLSLHVDRVEFLRELPGRPVVGTVAAPAVSETLVWLRRLNRDLLGASGLDPRDQEILVQAALRLRGLSEQERDHLTGQCLDARETNAYAAGLYRHFGRLKHLRSVSPAVLGRWVLNRLRSRF